MAKSKTNKPPTKKEQLIRMLKAKAGTDVATLSNKLGWQPHTTRAALTGLRKAGHEIIATKPEGRGASTYRIIGTTPKHPDAEVQNPR